MSNPLFAQFGNNAANMGGFGDILKAANSLRQQMQNPKAEVERLLNSGQMTQAQFNQFSQIANMIMGGKK